MPPWPSARARVRPSPLVPSLMGTCVAAEKLLGRPPPASRRVECGLANAVPPAGEVLNHARRVAAERFNSCPRRRCESK